MRCLDRLGANLVIQDEANSGPWAHYTPPESPDRGAWQPLSWNTSTWRHVADRGVRFAYNVTPHLVGNLADIPFDGQSVITQRGLGGGPVAISARRRCNYVGAGRFVEGRDPERFQIGGEDTSARLFAGPKTQFLAMAPWVRADGPREQLEQVARELGPEGNGELENDYLETVLVADLPFPPRSRRPSCVSRPKRARPRIRLRVSPSRVVAGEWRRFRLRATAIVFGERRAVRGAQIRFGGRVRRTDRQGRAAMTLRFAAPGRRAARARKASFRTGRASVRVLAPRGSA
jgi:hypothetical protein